MMKPLITRKLAMGLSHLSSFADTIDFIVRNTPDLNDDSRNSIFFKKNEEAVSLLNTACSTIRAIQGDDDYIEVTLNNFLNQIKNLSEFPVYKDAAIVLSAVINNVKSAIVEKKLKYLEKSLQEANAALSEAQQELVGSALLVNALKEESEFKEGEIEVREAKIQALYAERRASQAELLSIQVDCEQLKSMIQESQQQNNELFELIKDIQNNHLEEMVNFSNEIRHYALDQGDQLQNLLEQQRAEKQKRERSQVEQSLTDAIAIVDFEAQNTGYLTSVKAPEAWVNSVKEALNQLSDFQKNHFIIKLSEKLTDMPLEQVKALANLQDIFKKEILSFYRFQYQQLQKSIKEASQTKENLRPTDRGTSILGYHVGDTDSYAKISADLKAYEAQALTIKELLLSLGVTEVDLGKLADPKPYLHRKREKSNREAAEEQAETLAEKIRNVVAPFPEWRKRVLAKMHFSTQVLAELLARPQALEDSEPSSPLPPRYFEAIKPPQMTWDDSDDSSDEEEEEALVCQRVAPTVRFVRRDSVDSQSSVEGDNENVLTLPNKKRA